MRMPLVSSRMKQPGQPSRDRIDARNVRTLVSIAVDTCERKVLKLVSAAVLFCNDVVCLEGCWMRGRSKLTVFTASRVPLADLPDYFGVHPPLFRRWQRLPGLGTDHCQQVAHVDIAIQLSCLSSGQRAESCHLA